MFRRKRLPIPALAGALVWIVPVSSGSGNDHPGTLDDPAGRVVAVERVVAERFESEGAAYRVVQVVEGLEHPWALAWLPDGRMLVSERSGNLLLVTPGGDSQALEGLPPVHSVGQGGLLDVALHPEYATNRWIYFTYSSPGDADGVIGEQRGTGTALARARLSQDGSRLEDLVVLYTQVPRHAPGRHYGSRIVFPGDGTVIFSIGDRALRWPSQDLKDPGGSFVRLYENGGAYEANPFVRHPPGNLRPEIHSYGHRNNQAMLIHPVTGELWTAEHGPRGGDVLHVIEPGVNYGWPNVAFGVEYSTGERIGVGRQAPGVRAPILVWDESFAPSGMAYYDGGAFPAWHGNLFVGSLVRKQLQRLVIEGREVRRSEVLLDDVVGRIRDVRQGPDGSLYVVTDEEDGGVYRIEPA
jgi:aldose sugar dehydrogenase